ncbi:unnamed protein product [Tuber aestivum]|uniref:Mvd1 C-terminal domain-containing protein n=1 Tax=Tuber aestivum TaxID=59557 RepID=A0A292PQW9_9PEZI|nr:unnamed protein product [Tuber aestivum]
MKDAIKNKEFELLAGHTMADSKQLHVVYLDTAPAKFYRNDISSAGMRAFKGLNTLEGRVVGEGTFGAGLNSVVCYQERRREGSGLPGVLPVQDAAIGPESA